MMRMSNSTAAIVMVAVSVLGAGVCFVASAARADVVHLRSGGEIRGTVVGEGPAVVRIEVEGGTVTVSRDAVSSIERATPQADPWDTYRSRLAALDPADAAGFYELGDYCLAHGLYGPARQTFHRAAEADPALSSDVTGRLVEVDMTEAVESARWYVDGGEYAVAIKFLEDALAAHPGGPRSDEAQDLLDTARAALTVDVGPALVEAEAAAVDRPVRLPDVRAILFPAPAQAGLLTGFIESAERSISACLTGLASTQTTDALLAAENRGVLVRIILAGETSAPVEQLASAGASIVSPHDAWSLSDNFFIVDDSRVWIGSLLPLDFSAYYDNSEALVIRSSDFARALAAIFEKRYVGHDRRRREHAEGISRIFTLPGGDVIELYRIGVDDAASAAIGAVATARESVVLCASGYGDKHLTRALEERARRGVDVSAVIEKSSHRAGSYCEKLAGLGVVARLDKNPYKLRHNVIVIDERVAVLSSGDFSPDGLREVDGLLLVLHSPSVAGRLAGACRQLWAEGDE